MTVKERITALRARMKETGIDAYLIPTDDFNRRRHGQLWLCRLLRISDRNRKNLAHCQELG